MPPVGRPRPTPRPSRRSCRARRRARSARPPPGRIRAVRSPTASPAPSTRTRSAISSPSTSTRAVSCRPTTPRPARVRQQLGGAVDLAGAARALPCSGRTVSRFAVGRPATAPRIDTYSIPDRMIQDERVSDCAAVRLSRRRGPLAQLPGRRRIPDHLAAETTLYHAVRWSRRLRTRSSAAGSAAAHDVQRRRQGGQAAAGELRRHADLEPGMGSLREQRGRGTRAAVRRQGGHPHDRHLVREAGVGGRGHRAAAAYRWGFGTDEMFDASPGPLLGDGRGAVHQRRAWEHGEPPPHFRLPSRSRRLVESSPETQASEDGCAKTILTGLARGRRPSAASADVDTLMSVTSASAAPRRRSMGPTRRPSMGRLTASTRASSRRCSGFWSAPTSCSALEQDPAGRRRPAGYRITDVELASRLSFFLWSSIPDDELLDAGGARASCRIRRCSSGRSGACWPIRARRRSSRISPASGCSCATSATSSPDPDLFPDFDENLREAFRRETELFLESQLRDDRSDRRSC